MNGDDDTRHMTPGVHAPTEPRQRELYGLVLPEREIHGMLATGNVPDRVAASLLEQLLASSRPVRD